MSKIYSYQPLLLRILHNAIALTFLIVLPIFALYGFQIGDRRLVQA